MQIHQTEVLRAIDAVGPHALQLAERGDIHYFQNQLDN